MGRKKEKQERLLVSEWRTIAHPGFLGEQKDAQIARWNLEYGENNWRLAWELANGETLNYDRMFWLIFVPGYVRHFSIYPDQAVFLTQNYSHCFDTDPLTHEEAFNPQALYNQPGRNNQQHAVAINIALEWFLAMPFQGRRPLQVRENYPPESKQPEGCLWSPGRIATVRPELIPQVELPQVWWQKGTIEDLYQCAKVLQLKNVQL